MSDGTGPVHMEKLGDGNGSRTKRVRGFDLCPVVVSLSIVAMLLIKTLNMRFLKVKFLTESDTQRIQARFQRYQFESKNHLVGFV